VRATHKSHVAVAQQLLHCLCPMFSNLPLVRAPCRLLHPRQAAVLSIAHQHVTGTHSPGLLVDVPLSRLLTLSLALRSRWQYSLKHTVQFAPDMLHLFSLVSSL
jgi:hypothetical protein